MISNGRVSLDVVDMSTVLIFKGQSNIVHLYTRNKKSENTSMWYSNTTGRHDIYKHTLMMISQRSFVLILQWSFVYLSSVVDKEVLGGEQSQKLLIFL